jgi:hypothetical protein
VIDTIQGIKNAQAKIAQRLLSKEREEDEEKKFRRTREANEFVFSELKIQIEQLKESLKSEQDLKKSIASDLKRNEFLYKKEIQKKKNELSFWKVSLQANKCLIIY